MTSDCWCVLIWTHQSWASVNLDISGCVICTLSYLAICHFSIIGWRVCFNESRWLKANELCLRNTLTNVWDTEKEISVWGLTCMSLSLMLDGQIHDYKSLSNIDNNVTVGEYFWHACCHICNSFGGASVGMHVSNQTWWLSPIKRQSSGSCSSSSNANRSKGKWSSMIWHKFQ